MKRVVIDHIRKEFFSLRRGRINALDEISLDVDSGSFYVLLGPSGCGKSTLLNIIAGIERPTAGEIRIGDEPVVSVDRKIFKSPRERDIAMVFQSYALYPHLTVYENIAFPLKIAGVGKSDIRGRVADVARVLEIENLLDAKPRELSGGQRQRVALGRAIIRRPNLLLLDEPLSNLDALLRISMRGELKRLQRRLKVTTIYVTHDQTEAMSLGDRIAILKDGKVMQVGTPDEIYHDPGNEFVGRFVGTPPMNLLTGSVVTKIGTAFELPQGYEPSQLTIGVRPEHLRPVDEESGILRGTIGLVGFQGRDRVLYVRVQDQGLVLQVPEANSAGEGDIVFLDFGRDNIYFFDRESGQRVR